MAVLEGRNMDRDPFEYARQLDDATREWVRAELDHHRRQRTQLGEFVSQHGEALSPQGWVALTLRQHEGDITEVRGALSDDGWVRNQFREASRKQNHIFVVAVSILVTLITQLALSQLG